MEQNNFNNTQPTPTPAGSILDIIHEKAANIEQATNNNSIKSKLNESIKGFAKREEKLRLSTITLKLNEALTLNKITEIIEKKWTNDMRQVSPTYWQDREHGFCQFLGQKEKIAFLEIIKQDPECQPIKEALNNSSAQNTHYTRKPVKIEITNVRGNIQANKIKQIITSTAKPECSFSELKEGKPNPINKARSITFKANAAGTRHVFSQLEGAIPYVVPETNIRTKLRARINARPWTCRDCFQFGQHQCKGKLCQKCGSKDHITKTCKSLTKFCTNCRKRGHKAKDSHCQSYINELTKEIRKMDIPLEYFEDKNLRALFINTLQLK